MNEIIQNFPDKKVLFVDDEEKALKWFKRVVKDDFEVLTATSVDEGWEVLKENAQDIALVICDQRMPDKLGVELLKMAREKYPKIIRILTTAYSDLDSAIASINEGGIFQYIPKPWDQRFLRSVLVSAWDFYYTQRERDLLLNAKLSILQRMRATDRVQSLSVLATGLSFRLKNALSALASFTGQLPNDLRNEWDRIAKKQSQVPWQDLGLLARQENQSVLKLVKQLVRSIEPQAPVTFETLKIDTFIGAAAEAVGKNGEEAVSGIELDFSSELSALRVEAALLQRGFYLLLQSLGTAGLGGKLSLSGEETVSSQGTVSGIHIHLTTNSETLRPEQIARLFALLTQSEENKLSLDLLGAFFIIYHHGGEIALCFDRPDGLAVEIFLPLDAEQVESVEVEEGASLNKLLSRFDAWDASLL